MAEIAVSFFSEPNADSRTCRVSFPRVAQCQLHHDIRSAMQGSEFFACYMAPEGGVVALDRQGRHCQHLTVLLPTVGCHPLATVVGGCFHLVVGARVLVASIAPIASIGGIATI